MKKIHVALDKNSYDIIVGASILSSNAAHGNDPLASCAKGTSCLIVTDDQVGPLYGDLVANLLRTAGATAAYRCEFPAGERSKNLRTIEDVYRRAVSHRLDRRSVIVALGGGVVGDTAGFVAATYMRGIDYIQIPTSLVAQVDSSIGGKTGVDLPEGKNLVGAFYQPKLVLIDTDTLCTLPLRQLRCGLAEVIKYGIILDADFFEYLEQHVSELLSADRMVYDHVVDRCCRLKAQVVAEDPLDQGNRAILNYGHTFGHALETLAGYEGLTHGEAIAIGMCMAADAAFLFSGGAELRQLIDRQQRLFQALGLPTTVKGFTAEEIFRAMTTDKKFVHGRVRLIVPERIGRVAVRGDLPEALILRAIGGRCD